MNYITVVLYISFNDFTMLLQIIGEPANTSSVMVLFGGSGSSAQTILEKMARGYQAV